jgi:MGT family glycosyltransferase
MARIAMVVPVWVGHLNPMTTLGRELQRRGHQVSILSFPDASERVGRPGLEHRVIGAPVFPAGECERETRPLSRRSGLAAGWFTIRWMSRITPVLLEELPAALRSGAYDGVVVDQVCYGACPAAETAGVPLVVTCNALPVHFQPDIPIHSETWPWRTDRFSMLRNRIMQRILITLARPLWRPIRAAQKARGQPWNIWHYMNDLPPSLAQVAQLPACLDFPRRHAPDHFHHTGPWHESKPAGEDSFDWAWLDGRPLIYASLGTLQNGLEHLYQIILDACAGLPMQVVLTLGREDGTLPRRIPANAKVLGFGPQLALLRRSSVVITHAGLNTTLESLAQGLPMVALPITNEQPGIASRIRHAGVGEWLSIRRLTPGKLRDMVRRVHDTPGYRARSRECAKSLAGDPGLQRAAGIIEDAVHERRRVIRRTSSAGRRP